MRALRSTTTSLPTPGMAKPFRASLYARAASSSRNKATCFLVIPVFSESRFKVSDFEIPATYSSSAAVTRPVRAAFCTNAQERMMLRVSLRVTDAPPDRPEWLRETIRLLADWTTSEREGLLAMVDGSADQDLLGGTDEDWGLGQIATHLLVVERGVTLIGLRLATGAAPGPTGQPRPESAAVTRAGQASLAGK